MRICLIGLSEKKESCWKHESRRKETCRGRRRGILSNRGTVPKNDLVEKKHKFLYDPKIEADHHYTANGNTWKGIG